MRSRLLSALLVLVVAGCGGGGSGTPVPLDATPPGVGDEAATQPAALALVVQAVDGLSVGDLTLLSSTRVGRTVFDYTYTVRATNSGAVTLLGVTGTVTSQAATTVVTDAALSFGDLAPGASATSSDTFTIRQDRTAPLAAASLTITLAGTPAGGGPAEGVLLDGQPLDRALDRLAPQGPFPADPADLLGTYLLTRLDVTLAPDATVAEVNAALAAVGGGITAMRPGMDTVTVAVPRQADEAGLRALAEVMASQPGISFAFAGQATQDRAAPPAPADSAAQLQHLQDARFLAAWNARAAAGDCTGNRVVVIVPDNYLKGDGRVFASDFADFDGQVPGVPQTTQPAGITGTNLHGYNVLITMAAKADARPPTGAMPYPECLDIRPVERALVTANDLLQAFVDDALRVEAEAPGTGNFIVSHAWGFPSCDGPPCDPSIPAHLRAVLMPAVQMATVAAGYRRQLNRFAERMLTVSAAGNEAVKPVTQLYAGIGQAAYDSPMNMAARSDATFSWITRQDVWNPAVPCTPQYCAPSLAATAQLQAEFEDWLRRSGNDQFPAAGNVLIVGSVKPAVGGINAPSDFADAGSDVDAVGESIPTLPGGLVQGTSFSAPQVSGLAAYLWLLSPELRNRPVVDTINAIKANVCTIGCAGVVDAYATALALDSGQPLSPANSRIRLAILDVNGDSRFTEADLSLYLEAFRPGGMRIEPSVRDDSRHDLNGDGYTGGSREAALDLDPAGSPRFGRPQLTSVTTEVLGLEVTYAESGVTDGEALCYYASSPLYSGDTAQRYALLFDFCAGPGETYVGTLSENVTTDTTNSAGPEGSGTAQSQRSWNVRLDRQADGRFVPSGTGTVAETQVQQNLTDCNGRSERHTDTLVTQADLDIVPTPFLADDFRWEGAGTWTRTNSTTCSQYPTDVWTRDVTIGAWLTVVPGSEPRAVVEDGQLVAFEWDLDLTYSFVNGTFTSTRRAIFQGRLDRVSR